MISRKANTWLLWVYGVLCPIVLMLVRVGDAIATESAEIWYQDISYLVSATICVAMLGIVLLKSFHYRYAITVACVTSLIVWLLLWVAQGLMYNVLKIAPIYGEDMLFLSYVVATVVIAPLPYLLFRLIRLGRLS